MINRFYVRLVAASAWLIAALPGLTQSGAIDPGFQPRIETPGRVNALVPLDDGQILVGGSFHTMGGAEHRGLARLNADGTVDPSFTPVVEGVVQSIAVQPDGRIFLGGFLSWRDQEGFPSIARLLPDGSADETFIRDCIVEYSDVRSLVVCPDGRLLVGGFFGYVGRNLPWPQGAHFLNRVARLNADGTVDTDFNPGTAADSPYSAVETLALSPSGNIYVAGDFTSFNGLSKPYLVRLRGDGSVDPTFETWAGPNGPVTDLAVQNNGQLLISGTFNRVNGIARNGLARLDSNGAVDTTFRPELQGSVLGLNLGSDESICVAEHLSKGGVYLTRFRPEGTLAGRSQDAVRHLNGWPVVECLIARSSGGLLLGGVFDQVGPAELNSIAAFDPEDRVIPGFAPQPWQSTAASAAVAGPDGSVVVCGLFTRINSERAFGVARLSHQGTVDSSFDASQLPAGGTYALTELADRSLLMGGIYRYRDGRAAPYLLHVLPDGTLDDAYPLVVDGVPRAFYRAPNGMLLMGGGFFRVNGSPCPGLVRLHPDGQPDAAFDLGDNNYASTFAIAVQSTGKLLIGGNWQAQGSLDRSYLSRLNADGSPDPSFVRDHEFDSIVTALATDPKDRILVGGWFRQVNGLEQPGLIRLLPDGDVDSAFQAELGRFSEVETLHVLADGRILATGEIYPPTGPTDQGVALLLENGTRDPSFETLFPAALRVRVWATAVVSDEEAILSNTHYDLDGLEHPGLHRLFVSGNSAIRLSPPQLGEAQLWNINALLLGPAPPSIVLEHSPDGLNWSFLSTHTITANPLPLSTPQETTAATFFRARSP